MTDRVPPASPDPRSNLPVPASVGASPAQLAGALGRAPAPPPPAESGDPEKIPWARYFDAARRFWWLILLATTAGVVAGRYLMGNAIPEYTATAQIWIGAGGATRGGGAPRPQQVLTQSSWELLLRNPRVVEPVVMALRLNVWPWAAQDEPLFTAFELDSVFQPGNYRLTIDTLGQRYTLANDDQPAATPEAGTVGDSIGRTFGFRWFPPASALTPRRVVRFNVTTVRAAAASNIGRLRTSLPPEDGQFLTMTLVGPDPQRLAATLNAWADQFIIEADDITKSELRTKREVLEASVSRAAQEFAIAERAQQEFRRAVSLEPADLAATGGGTVTSASTAAALNLQRNQSTQTQREIATLRAILADTTADGGINATAFLRLSGTGAAIPPELRTALDQLTAAEGERTTLLRVLRPGTDQVLEVDDRIATLRRITIPQIARSMLATLNEVAAQQDSTIATQERTLRAIPDRVTTGHRLNAAFTTADALYQGLRRDLEMARIAEAQATANLTIMAPAVAPSRPSSNQGPRLFLIAVIAGLGAGIGAALLLDRLDRRFRYPEQATMDLGLTIIGTIPRFRINRRGELGVTAMSQVVEAFRTLRLGIRHHFPLDQPVVLAVSSPGAGEGKSLVTSNLAIAFANAGHRTLLIDGDVRRGIVHATFERERRPGLVDHLAGRAAISEVLAPTATENLWILPSGQRSRTAPELLVSDGVHAMLAELRQQFEIIIIDTAPLAAGVDAYALAAAAGSMLVVLRPGVTDRKLAGAKLEVLDRLPVAVIGAVLNGIHGGGAYRYYYSDYNDYAVQDEDDEPVGRGKSDRDRPIPRLLAKR